ncbi:interleukin-15 receptor subunit alpha isoform X2 [Tyto alba]|uniref:interleukin-15 receptor subunit alpha isoform X2 n=1 Tax=Tyto alba TaxID=56313 RepID=UPI001C6697D6|nr:interleukin-15 receptor subunit alpha isoform X2 [Tyto alba]
MAGPLLPLLCGAFALLLPWASADTAPARCSHPKDVANAHIDAGDNLLLNTRLRYTCNPGYKRKAGTSSLIQCILRDGSAEPDWTPITLQCIPGSPDASPTSSPSPAATPGLPGAANRSLVPPAPAEPAPVTPTPPELLPPLEPSSLGEVTAPGKALGTTSLPTAPTDHAAVSIQTLASSIGLPVLVVAGVVACCCWRMKTRAGRDYAVVAIPMAAPVAENEMSPPGVFPTG